MQQTIDDFCNWMAAQRKSPLTVISYRAHLRRLAVWGAEQRLTEAVQFKERHLTRYIAERQLQDELGAASVQVLISAFRKFFRWVLGKRKSPAEGLEFPRAEAQEQRTLTRAQALKILEMPDTSGLMGRRDLAMLCLLLDTGLRASEICALEVENLFLGENYLVVRGKRNKLLVKAFCEYTAIQLANWLGVRQAAPECGRVFVSVRHGSGHRAPPGKALTRQALRGMCARAAAYAGLPELSPHDFRRTCVSFALLQGCPDRVAELQLGWGESARDMLTRYTLALRARSFLPYSPVAWLMRGAFSVAGEGELNP